MSVLADILLWAVLGLLILFVIVLVTPVRVRAHLHSAPGLEYRVDARVLGGLSPRLALADSSRPAKPRKKTKKPRKRPRRRSASGGRKDMLGALPRLVRELLEVVHIEELRIDAVFGMNDPADTGRVFGYLAPLQYAIPLPAQVTFALRPDFARPGFAGNVDAAARFTAAAFVPPVVRFFWRVYGPGR